MKKNRMAMTVLALFVFLKLFFGPDEALMRRAAVWLGWEAERVEALGSALLGEEENTACVSEARP